MEGMAYPVIDVSGTGQQINRLRKERGVSVPQMAAYLGVSTVSIYKWFRGETLPSIDNLFALSVAFGTPMDKMLVQN